ncbi:hypothetical protein SEA_PLATTE_15 [Microbacterium phage Platte]|nr:hypothetical protein SEA_PLATTE_15 [Microbacterium phage Platte]
MADRSWMDVDERAEFEENRKDLIESAYEDYGITLKVNKSDEIYIENADLEQMVEFYMSYRSEIEEML